MIKNATLKLCNVYSKCSPFFSFKNKPKNFGQPLVGLDEGIQCSADEIVFKVGDIIGPSGENGPQRKYIVESKLGHGSFGQVIRCMNIDTYECFAVKVIKHQSKYEKQAFVERSILQDLVNADPNDTNFILRLKDSFVYKGNLCLVTDLLGMDLYQYLKKCRSGFSLEQIRDVMYQLLSALELVHELSIIHCDLKLENVLIDRCFPHVRLIDFGLSTYENKSIYTYIQSRYYRAPEIILGMGYTTKIDIWSLGCIAVELFIGNPLFPGSNDHDMLMRMMGILGPLPTDFVEGGQYSFRFFTTVVAPHHHQSTRTPTPCALSNSSQGDDGGSGNLEIRLLTQDEFSALDALLQGSHNASHTSPTTLHILNNTSQHSSSDFPSNPQGFNTLRNQKKIDFPYLRDTLEETLEFRALRVSKFEHDANIKNSNNNKNSNQQKQGEQGQGQGQEHEHIQQQQTCFLSSSSSPSDYMTPCFRQARAYYNLPPPPDFRNFFQYIRLCLCYSPQERPSAGQLLMHPFIQNKPFVSDWRPPPQPQSQPHPLHQPQPQPQPQSQRHLRAQGRLQPQLQGQLQPQPPRHRPQPPRHRPQPLGRLQPQPPHHQSQLQSPLQPQPQHQPQPQPHHQPQHHSSSSSLIPPAVQAPCQPTPPPTYPPSSIPPTFFPGLCTNSSSSFPFPSPSFSPILPPLHQSSSPSLPSNPLSPLLNSTDPLVVLGEGHSRRHIHGRKGTNTGTNAGRYRRMMDTKATPPPDSSNDADVCNSSNNNPNPNPNPSSSTHINISTNSLNRLSCSVGTNAITAATTPAAVSATATAVFGSASAYTLSSPLSSSSSYTYK